MVSTPVVEQRPHGTLGLRPLQRHDDLAAVVHALRRRRAPACAATICGGGTCRWKSKTPLRRAERAMRRVSSNPAVVITPVRAPESCAMTFVATVLPLTKTAVACQQVGHGSCPSRRRRPRGSPPRPRCSRAASTAPSPRRGARRRTSTTASVCVPPMSIPIWYVVTRPSVMGARPVALRRTSGATLAPNSCRCADSAAAAASPSRARTAATISPWRSSACSRTSRARWPRRRPPCRSPAGCGRPATAARCPRRRRGARASRGRGRGTAARRRCWRRTPRGGPRARRLLRRDALDRQRHRAALHHRADSKRSSTERASSESANPAAPPAAPAAARSRTSPARGAPRGC